MIYPTGTTATREEGAKNLMRNRIATTIALVTSTLAIIVPIIAALYLAHHQSREESSAQAMLVAGEVLRRAETVSEEALAAYQRLSRTELADACTDAKRARLREIVMDYSYLQPVGYVSNSRILCSAIGPRDDGIDLGPPSYVSPRGVRIYLSVTIADSRRLLVLEYGGFAAAIHPEALLDVSAANAESPLGVYSLSSQRLWSHRGAFNPAWMTALRGAPQAVVFDGNYLVAVRASNEFDLATYVAIPRVKLESRLRVFMIILLPIGLALGAAMAGAIMLLARQRASLPALLRAALKRNEFVLYYQPIVEIRSGPGVDRRTTLLQPPSWRLHQRQSGIGGHALR